MYFTILHISIRILRIRNHEFCEFHIFENRWKYEISRTEGTTNLLLVFLQWKTSRRWKPFFLLKPTRSLLSKTPKNFDNGELLMILLQIYNDAHNLSCTRDRWSCIMYSRLCSLLWQLSERRACMHRDRMRCENYRKSFLKSLIILCYQNFWVFWKVETKTVPFRSDSTVFTNFLLSKNSKVVKISRHARF